jgi:hypothetical protein
VSKASGGSRPKSGRLPGGASRWWGRHRIRRCAQGEGAGRLAISTSRKTCSTCFPRCCLRSGFQTEPVTDDWYNSDPSTEPHHAHAHVGTDLCPSHGSPYCQYPRGTETRDRHPRRPQSDRRTNCEPGYPALPLHPWVVFCRTPQRAGSLGWTTAGQHTEHSPADVDVRPDWQYPRPAGNQTSTPGAATSPDCAASRVLPVQTDRTHRSGQPQASLTPARQRTPTARTGPCSKVATD